MENFLKVKDHPGLYRDPVSKAIIVDDPTGRKTYQMQRQTLVKSLGAAEQLREEINSIKTEMDEIKSLLKDLTTHLKTN